MRDWSGGRARGTTERRQMRDWSGGRTRRTVERRQMRDGTRRGSRRNMEKDQLRVESRSIEGRSVSRKIESVEWRRIRDSHWRRTGEWLSNTQTQDVPTASHQRDTGDLRVPKPMDQAVSMDPLWRPWDEARDTQDLVQTVSELRASIVGSHKEFVPSSHPFVKAVPHTSHEIFPSQDVRTKKSIFKGIKQK